MNDNDLHITKSVVRREPWNKGKLIGPKPPLRPKRVWAIRTKLQLEKRVRDLALFNLSIDSKLRGGDVVSIRVEDFAPRGYAVHRAIVRQKKTGRPVKFELTDQTRGALDAYIKEYRREAGQWLFSGQPWHHSISASRASVMNLSDAGFLLLSERCSIARCSKA